ncbi:unnamed protein product [Withania somnifera]
MKLKDYFSSDTLTLVVINLAYIMEIADDSLLPGVYNEVGKDLHIDPAGLGSLSLYGSLVKCICYPLAAFLAARYNRAHVIAAGAFLWSAATFLVAISSNFAEPFPLLQFCFYYCLMILPQLCCMVQSFLLGFFASWSGPATNSPIFAEIVPERARTSIYALDRSFESILSSFAPPLVGILAEKVFGYKPIPEESSSSGEIETGRENAASLAKAMYTAIGIPMIIGCSIYSFLYCTYPRDRDRVRLQQIDETGKLPSEEQQPLLEHDEHRLHSATDPSYRI